jgi:hypothetical protein
MQEIKKAQLKAQSVIEAAIESWQTGTVLTSYGIESTRNAS